MILLAIESATDLVGVAVAADDGPRAAVWVTGRRRHGETLAPAIAHVLEQSGLALEDVEAVAVDLGPGLFTGLRVGVVTAKGLAQSLGVGIVGITSVEVLARAAFDAGWTGPVVAVVDARRGEVFAARFRALPGAPVVVIEEVEPPRRYRPDEIVAALVGLPADDGPVLAVGDGALRYAADLAGVPGLVVAASSPVGPSPAVLATLAAERIGAGAAPSPPEAVQPVYLRDADVRINWTQRGPAARVPSSAGRVPTAVPPASASPAPAPPEG